MRACLSVFFLLALAVPAAAQPSMTPPPPPGTVTIYPAGYYPTYVPATAVIAPRPYRPQGVYFSESFGGVRYSGEGADLGTAMRIRIAVGYRYNQLALELWGGGAIGGHRDYRTNSDYSSIGEPNPTDGGSRRPDHLDGDLGFLGLDVKYIKSVSRNFEVYGKGTISHAYGSYDVDGAGLGLGAGAQLKGKVPVIGFLFWPLFFTGIGPKCTAAIYLETGYEFYRMQGFTTTDVGLTHWTLGFAVGSDF